MFSLLLLTGTQLYCNLLQEQAAKEAAAAAAKEACMGNYDKCPEEVPAAQELAAAAAEVVEKYRKVIFEYQEK